MKSFEVAELGSPEAIQAQPPFHPASVNKVNKDITCAPCLVWGAGDIFLRVTQYALRHDVRHRASSSSSIIIKKIVFETFWKILNQNIEQQHFWKYSSNLLNQWKFDWPLVTMYAMYALRQVSPKSIFVLIVGYWSHSRANLDSCL